MPDILPNLKLPLLKPAQAQKAVTHNEALLILDSLVQLSVLDRDRTFPPSGLSEIGARHIVAAPGALDWAGQADAIATMTETGWRFDVPEVGFVGFDQAQGELIAFTQTGWTALAFGNGMNNITELGINATADTTNRLALSAPASLFTHEGAGHQVKVNKAAVGDTASLLFQSGYDGHAEIGLTGDNSLSFNVSPDGATWHKALSLHPTTGHASGAAIQQSATDVTAGRLMRADFGYSPGNLLGTVSEASGLPTGAVIESGSNANGQFVRFADGTQICHAQISMLGIGFTTAIGATGFFAAGEQTWTFPATFIASARVSATMQRSNSTVLGMVSLRNSPSATAASYLPAISQSLPAADTAARSVHLLAIGRWF